MINNVSNSPIASSVLTLKSRLEIRFDASTIDGLIIKDRMYTPSMSNPRSYASFPSILFIPIIRLNRNMFDQSLGEEDIKKIFLSPSQFNIFIEQKLANNIYKKVSLSQADKKGIIHENILFILSLFFKKGNKFVVNDTNYIVNTYNWDNEYKYNELIGQNTSVFNIKLNFMLHQGSELSFIDSTRLNCLQKKNDIIRDYYVLSGINTNQK